MTTGRSVDWKALADWATATAGIALTGEQLAQLRAYVDVLMLWNRKLSLVSQREPGDILAKHVADALFCASRCTAHEAVVDLGSGAGFPGLPIAITRPGARVCLVESRGKKATFLEEACRIASIHNVSVYHGRIEACAAEPGHRTRYTAATARALTSTAEFVALARPFLAPGGRAIAMRSVTESRSGEPPDAEEMAYTLPDGTPRRLVIVRV